MACAERRHTRSRLMLKAKSFGRPPVRLAELIQLGQLGRGGLDVTQVPMRSVLEGRDHTGVGLGLLPEGAEQGVVGRVGCGQALDGLLQVCPEGDEFLKLLREPCHHWVSLVSLGHVAQVALAARDG